MKKVIFDIGTHRYEELKFLFGNFGDKYIFYTFWVRSSLQSLIKKKNINKFGYSRSFFELNLKQHIKILKFLLKIRKNNYPYKIICIDPNFVENIENNFKRKFLDFYSLNLAIGESDKDTIYLKKLFLSRNSLSNNIYLSNEDQVFNLVPCTSFNNILKILIEKKIIFREDEFILRMNCEGSEFFIIKDLLRNNLSLNLICGSLNDVKKKHGDEEYKNMMNLLKERNINFVYFKASDPSSWLNIEKYFFDEISRYEKK